MDFASKVVQRPSTDCRCQVDYKSPGEYPETLGKRTRCKGEEARPWLFF